MPYLDRRTASVLLTILLFAAVLAVAYFARTVLVICCFSILFAYLIDPIVRFLQGHSLFFRNLRGPHVAEAYVALLIVAAVLVHTLAPGSLSKTVKFLRDLPTLSDRLATGEVATEMGGAYGWNDDQTGRVRTFLVQHRSSIQKITRAVTQFTSTAIGAIAVIPILAIFFLSGGKRLSDSVIRVIARNENYESVQSLADELHDDAATLHSGKGHSRRSVV